MCSLSTVYWEKNENIDRFDIRYTQTTTTPPLSYLAHLTVCPIAPLLSHLLLPRCPAFLNFSLPLLALVRGDDHHR